jgi:hypothetical protein
MADQFFSNRAKTFECNTGVGGNHPLRNAEGKVGAEPVTRNHIQSLENCQPHYGFIIILPTVLPVSRLLCAFCISSNAKTSEICDLMLLFSSRSANCCISLALDFTEVRNTLIPFNSDFSFIASVVKDAMLIRIPPCLITDRERYYGCY